MAKLILKSVMALLLLLARIEVKIVPVSWLFARGRVVVRAMFRFLPGVRGPLLENARHVLGPLSTADEQQHLGQAVLYSFSTFFVETLTAPRCFPTPEEFEQRIVGREHGEAAKARGKGVIAITIHMGNFELGPMVFSRIHQPLAIVYHRDPLGVVESMRSKKRGQHEVEEIHTDGSPFFGVKVLDLLRRGGFALLAGDRGFAHQKGQPYPFFDGQARFLTWPARLALKSGAPLLPCFVVREVDGKYALHLEPPIFPEDARGEGVDGLMRRLVPCFEDYVRRYPEQWLILHKYWEEA